MMQRLASEWAYASGIIRILRRTTPIGRHPNHSLRELIEEVCARHAPRVALISESETLTYRELNARANRYARWAMAQGLAKGDTVALLMPNRAEYIAIWIGLAKAGVVTALINTNLTGRSLAHCVNVVSARCIITDARLSSALESARDQLEPGIVALSHGPGPDPRVDEAVEAFSDEALSGEERRALTINDKCLYIYTSGTTGLPKAANMNHYRVQLAMRGFWGVTDTRQDDRVYDCLPLYHSVGGILGPGVALMAGGACVIREKFSARDFWADVVRYDCSVFCYIGELCRYLVNSPPGPHDRAHRVRLCFGNGLRPDVWVPFRDRFGLKAIREYYAATEGNAMVFNFDSKPGSVGRIPFWLKSKFPIEIVRFDVEAEQPVRNAEGRCEICDFGEVGEMIGEIINDPSKPGARFEGYADKKETERKIIRDVLKPGDAWFRTGDLMRRDARGYFYFVDRVGDTFRWKGENVSTNEVSERMTGFPGLLESSVYGVTVPGQDGRAGMASLVVEDMARFDLSAFGEYLATQLPEYARPVFLRFQPKLDVTGTFKQRKLDLVNDGFDPARIADPLYFHDIRARALVPLDDSLHADIVAGRRRL